MNLEDRLRSHMNEQMQALDMQPGDPNDLGASRSTTQRALLTGVTALAVVALAGFAFFSVAPDGSDIQATDTEESQAELGGDQGAEQDGGEGSGDDQGDSVATGAVTTDVTFTPIDAKNGPSPWNQSKSFSTGDNYYVLSTAPGKVKVPTGMASEEEYAKFYRPNTIYHFNRSTGWQNTTIEDRYVSSLTQDGDTLYLLSTGAPNGGTDLTLGTSSDDGQNWTWASLTGFPVDRAARTPIVLASVNGQQYVIASRGASPDWDEASAAARNAGYDVENNPVMNVDHLGFSFLDGPPAPPECEALMARMNELQSQMEAELEGLSADGIDGADGSKENEIFKSFESQMVALDREIAVKQCWGPMPCDMSGFPLAEAATFDAAEVDADGAEVSVTPTTVGVEDSSASESEASREEYARLAAENCVDPTTVTWAEIGFDPPASWDPWGDMFRIDGSNLTSMGLPFEPSYLEVSSTGDQIRLTVAPPYVEGNYEDLRPTTWSTADGVSWSSAPGDFGGRFAPVVGDTAFRIGYGNEGSEFTIERSVANGGWVQVQLSEITGGDVTSGPEGPYANLISAGGAVFATVYGEHSEDGPPAAETTYYTVDGVTWQEAPGKGSISPVAAGAQGTIVSFVEHNYEPVVGDDGDEIGCCQSDSNIVMMLVEPEVG